jgi:hypothetical protein
LSKSKTEEEEEIGKHKRQSDEEKKIDKNPKKNK